MILFYLDDLSIEFYEETVLHVQYFTKIPNKHWQCSDSLHHIYFPLPLLYWFFFQNAFYTCNILPIYYVIPGDMVQWTAHNISQKGKKWFIMLRGYKRAKWWLWAIEVCTSNLLPVSFSFACHHLNRKVDRTM